MPDYRRNKARYNKGRFKTTSPKKRSNEQALILGGLNVLQVLEDQAPQYLQHVLWYGPGTFAGTGHAATILWYRRKGYQTYQTLTLFGVWVRQDTHSNQIIIGSKSLDYSASVYNAEAYHTIIQQTFLPYYGNDTAPPAETGILYQTAFDVTQRLTLRKEIAVQLKYWFRNTLFT